MYMYLKFSDINTLYNNLLALNYYTKFFILTKVGPPDMCSWPSEIRWLKNDR